MQKNECLHVMHETVEKYNDTYMVTKVCIMCYHIEGYGFLNKEHEIRTLEKMLENSKENDTLENL
jgi:hypothetical protein